jgi:hypothetical protein
VVFFLLFRWVAVRPSAPALFAGFVAGVPVYDTVHYAVHHFSLHNPMLLFLRSTTTAITTTIPRRTSASATSSGIS